MKILKAFFTKNLINNFIIIIIIIIIIINLYLKN